MNRPTTVVQPNTGTVDIPTPVLYRCFDLEGTLLYVGMTNRPERRFKEHRRKPWWPQVDHIELSSYRNYRSLEQAERRAIFYEQPKYNKGDRDAHVHGLKRAHLSSEANRFNTVNVE